MSSTLSMSCLTFLMLSLTVRSNIRGDAFGWVDLIADGGGGGGGGGVPVDVVSSSRGLSD